MLHPYITSELFMVLYYMPTSWKHTAICFYVNPPSAEVLDSFLIEISEGLTERLNHQASCWGFTPSGGCSAFAPICPTVLLVLLIYSPPLMKCLRYDTGQGLTGGHAIRMHPEPNDSSESQHLSADLDWREFKFINREVLQKTQGWGRW